MKKFIANDQNKLRSLELNKVPSFMKSTKSQPSYLAKNNSKNSSAFTLNNVGFNTISNERINKTKIDIPAINMSKLNSKQGSDQMRSISPLNVINENSHIYNN